MELPHSERKLRTSHRLQFGPTSRCTSDRHRRPDTVMLERFAAGAHHFETCLSAIQRCLSATPRCLSAHKNTQSVKMLDRLRKRYDGCNCSLCVEHDCRISRQSFFRDGRLRIVPDEREERT